MDRVAATYSVKQTAQELGFDACCIAAAELMGDGDAGFDRWFEEGYFADMDWLARTRHVRSDIRLFLPGVRSVIVLAKAYAHPSMLGLDVSPVIARYAWNRDYHRVLAKPLKKLAAHVSGLAPEACCRASVDSGPVRERFWAVRSGLGWIGRNGLVICPGLGSWFNLAVIATTVELEADVPASDGCGACAACVAACPTGAIKDARLVDARRCLSWHTVESGQDIPQDIRERMSGIAFGCDRCQEVCPWNCRTRLQWKSVAGCRTQFASLTLEGLSALSRDEYEDVFAGTPVKRAGWERLVKNARLAAGHSTEKPKGPGANPSSPETSR